jgi:hypothetical protein
VIDPPSDEHKEEIFEAAFDNHPNPRPPAGPPPPSHSHSNFQDSPHAEPSTPADLDALFVEHSDPPISLEYSLGLPTNEKQRSKSISSEGQVNEHVTPPVPAWGGNDAATEWAADFD